MKTIQKLVLAALLFTGLNALAADVEWVDRIVAVANKEVITERELQDMMNNLKSAVPKEQADDKEFLRQAALDQLINQKLVIQIAQRNQISVSDAEVDAMIDRLAQDNKLSVSAFYTKIAKEGVGRDALRKTISENILVSRITEQEMANRTQVAPEEVAQFLAANPQMPEAKQFEVAQILIKSDSDKSDKAARNLLLNLKKKAANGVSFEALAKEYSQDATSAAQGGYMGWVEEGMSSPELDNVLTSLQAGKISQPLKSGMGWHLIYLKDVRVGPISPQRQQALAHNYIMQQKSAGAYQAWLQELRNGSYINLRDKPY